MVQFSLLFFIKYHLYYHILFVTYLTYNYFFIYFLYSFTTIRYSVKCDRVKTEIESINLYKNIIIVTIQ